MSRPLYTYSRIQGWIHPADERAWRDNGRRHDELPPVTPAWRVADAMSWKSPGIIYRPQTYPVRNRGYLVVPAGTEMPADDSPAFTTLRDAASALARYADTGDDRYLYGAMPV